MPTTAEYLERLVQAKNNIADAITNAGGTVNSGDGLEDFSTDIGTIPTGGNIDSLTVYSNGTYTAPSGTDGYNPVNVYVSNSYSASDEGKVVDNGALVSQTSTTFNDNGTYNTTLNNEVTVAVPLTTKSITTNGTYNASSDSVKGYSSVDVNVANTYTQADESKVVNNNALVSQTSASDSNINTNGTYTYDTTYNNSKKVIVAVPNTYTNADEGKVVSNGALTAQTARTLTTNNTTYDTTLNNSITVDIAIPQPTLITKSITSNGTYNASSDSADGYSSVSVAVPNTYSAGDEGKVVSNGALVSQTATSTNVNGTVDTTLNNSIVVNVPNTYTAGDEGKVVSNGALVAQTSDTITTDGIYDTTLINSVTVSVGGGTPTGGATRLYNSSSYNSTTGEYGTWCIGIADTITYKRLFICGEGTITTTNLTTKYVNPSDINFSDYLSADKTVTVQGYYYRRYQSGGTWQTEGTTMSVTVVIKPSTNTVTLKAPATNNYSGTRYYGFSDIS